MNKDNGLILGLDIGSDSIGWGLIEIDENRCPSHIVDAGVRIFQAGMDGDIASGKAESRCANRRNKRMIRKQLARRKRRMRKLKNFLQKNNFLPSGNDIGRIIENIDKELLKKYEADPKAVLFRDVATLHHNLPYLLRKKAIDKTVERHEFGRLMYHLAHRRGFLSNRKSAKQDDTGEVKKGIAELTKKIEETTARTLGEYFSSLDPEEDRIRARWTSRQMYIDEFNLLCERQKTLISEKQKKALFKIIFYQRKLKNTKHLVGNCVLEPEEKRCPWYRNEAQQFRIYQTINNLRVMISDSEERELSSEEWRILSDALNGHTKQLDKDGNLNISKAKTLLKLPKTARLSIEKGGEKKIKGNVINAKMIKIFGEKWFRFSDQEREEVLQDLRSYTNQKALARRAMKRWGLNEEQASDLSETILPDEYCSLSLKAINKLLPKLEEGISYSTAVKQTYPEQFEPHNNVCDLILPVNKVFDRLRNPVVNRCLTETRKIVNAVIKKYGKPDTIRIELARDIKNSKREKDHIIKIQRDNENTRSEAKRKIFDELRIGNPSGDEILKVILANECNWECPYTQRVITPNSLIGQNPQFDVEHIIPYSRSLDNSFANKTLCYMEENRNVKQNKTPYEAYSGNKDKYDRIIMSVSKFKGPFAKEKNNRFLMTSEEVENRFEDFSSRQLNDTRYSTKEAMKYLGLLYGGIVDKSGERKIQALSGGITYIVRSFLGMNNILGDGVKNRDDHRHHAVDAIAIAMTDHSIVKKITDMAKRLEKEQVFSKKRFRIDEPISPYKKFYNELKAVIHKIISSHHISKKVRGALHEESIYGETPENGVVSIKKSLDSITDKDVGKIIDPAIKKIVEDKLSELGVKNPSKAFSSKENLPVLRKKDGSVSNTIKSVKIQTNLQTTELKKNGHIRHVKLGNNHHMEIVAVLDKDGNEIKWEGYPVSLFDAKQRLKNGEPLIKKDFGAGRKFKFSLCCGDIIQRINNDAKELFVIRTVPQSKQIMFVRINDSRKQNEIKESKEWFSAHPDSLRKANYNKIMINTLGEIRTAND